MKISSPTWDPLSLSSIHIFAHTVTFCKYRSTPVETLHTVLLGPYKYLLSDAMSSLTTQQKKEVLAKTRAFNYSGFDGKVLGNIVHHHKFFVGRDYKAWAQMALFIIGNYLSEEKCAVLLALSKVSGLHTSLYRYTL